MTEMVRWHHQLNGHELEPTLENCILPEATSQRSPSLCLVRDIYMARQHLQCDKCSTSVKSDSK